MLFIHAVHTCRSYCSLCSYLLSISFHLLFISSFPHFHISRSTSVPFFFSPRLNSCIVRLCLGLKYHSHNELRTDFSLLEDFTEIPEHSVTSITHSFLIVRGSLSGQRHSVACFLYVCDLLLPNPTFTPLLTLSGDARASSLFQVRFTVPLYGVSLCLFLPFFLLSYYLGFALWVFSTQFPVLPPRIDFSFHA